MQGYNGTLHAPSTMRSRLWAPVPPDRILLPYQADACHSPSFSGDTTISDTGTMNDIELQSLTDFQEVTSADAAAVLLEKILETSLATFQSHEDTDESDSNDDELLAVIVSRSTDQSLTKVNLQRQKVYSKKYVKKKEHNKIAMANSFVAGLKLVNILLEGRIERTKTVTMTRRLISLDKNDKWYDVDLHTIEREATQQLALNHAAMNFVDAWVATWCHSKTENGKFFLKPWASKIDDCIGALAHVGTKLDEETTELKFCVLQAKWGVDLMVILH